MINTKECTKCKLHQDMSHFILNNKYKDGYTTWCRGCFNKATSKYWKKHKIESRIKQRRLRLQNPERYKNYSRQNGWKSKGINCTLDKYNELYIKQKGLCAICRIYADNIVRRLAIDHDHKTGNIRGLLCFACNVSLGKFKDSVVLLEKAIQYLNNGGITK